MGWLFFVLFYWYINLFSILFMIIFKKKRYEDKKRTRNGKQNRKVNFRDNDHVFYF